MAKANKKKKMVAREKQRPSKKRIHLKPIIAAVIAALLVAALVVFIVIRTNEDSAKHVLLNTTWVSQTAKTASGDEVDIREVYNVKYSNYQGTLSFDGENGFELWLHPSDISDGTHKGSYELDGDKLKASFDGGTDAEFSLTRNDGGIVRIDVPYDNYVVSFFSQ